MDQKEKTDIRSLNLKELTVFMEQLRESVPCKADLPVASWEAGSVF